MPQRPRDNGHHADPPLPPLPSVVWTPELLLRAGGGGAIAREIEERRQARRVEALTLLRRVLKILEQDA